MVHDTTFIDDLGFYLVLSLALCSLPGGLIAALWVQYKNRKKELGIPNNYTFKNYLKWLFEGIWSDLWKFLRMLLLTILVIAGILLTIALIYLVFVAISSGIDQLSVKGVLVIIAALLVLIYLKK